MNIKKLLFFISLTYSFCALKMIQPQEPTLLSEKKIRSALGQLSLKEIERLEAYLRKQLKLAKNSNDREKANRYKLLLKNLYNGQSDLILIALLQQEQKIDNVLQITKLREKIILKNLEIIPWFMQEIGALEWIFEVDAKKLPGKQKWPRA